MDSAALDSFPFFPFEVMRPQQEQLVRDIELALQQKKILLAHAPTGLGKTASALSVALQIALEEKKVVFFLTNRHTQHQLAVETLKSIKKKSGVDFSVVDMIGKRWMCSQNVATLFGSDFNEYCKHVVEHKECEFYTNVHGEKTLQVQAKLLVKQLQQQGPLHTDEVITSCKEEKMCGYEISLALAKGAQLLIGDYNYLFNPFIKTIILGKMDRKMEEVILIVDEGHNLPGRVTEMMSSTLSSFTLRNAMIEAKKFKFEQIIVWLQELLNILDMLAQFDPQEREKEKKVEKQQFIAAVQNVIEYDQLIDQLELAAEEIREQQQRSYLGGLAAFLESWKGPDEGYVRYIAERHSKFGSFLALDYACLDPSQLTRDIFQMVHGGVIMSGTLKPTFMYRDVLGIGEKGMEREYGSPFPRENKIHLIIPETTTKYTLRNETMYQKIAEKCSELCHLISGNVALFFPSYEMRDEISRYLSNSKKLFWEKREMSKDEKEEFLNEFKNEKDRGGILLGVAGANFAEGIDLPGDLLQGVIVVGLPLAKPDLKNREVISYYDQKFNRGWDYGYIYPALNKCFQSAGRCIRSETDRGVMIFLDERFAWQRYFCCFPRGEVVVTKHYQPLLKAFFGKG